MRRIVSFVLSAVVVQLGVAGIASANEELNKYKTWKVECRFLGDSGKKDKDKAPRQCYATAYYHDYKDLGIANEDDRFKPKKDYLAVACDGNVIYDNGAKHTEIGGFDFISGHGGTPVIKFHHSYKDEVVSAWLNLNGQILEGFCSIEKQKYPALE